MNKYLCAVEAVNLDNLFSDCHDLSTTRGGGLAVLRIADEVAKRCKIRMISGGASQGIFEMAGPSREDTEKEIRDALRKMELYEHTTIMVAVTEDDGIRDFPSLVADLKGQMRLAQMRSPSVVYPRLQPGNAAVCQVDQLRPARPRSGQPDKKNTLSDFTYERRELGKREKTALVREILAGTPLASAGVVNNLNELAAGDEKRFGNAAKKIAVLRFDGNSFGAISGGLGREELAEFSRVRRREQTAYIRALVEQNPEEWMNQEGKLRLEIVVYGGDEVTVVVPAWLGWHAAETFYRVEKKGSNITYAGGLVFCHSNAPIHSIRKLASELADAAKDYAADKEGKKGDYLVYEVLESFDAIGRKLKAYHEERYGKTSAGMRGALIGPGELALFRQHMKDWRTTLSKRGMREIAMEVLRGEARKGEDMMKRLVEGGDGEAEGALQAIRELKKTLGDAAILHILELWDYVEAGA